MAQDYVVTKRIFGFDETKTEKFVVTPVSAGEVSFEKLCKQVTQICGAHRGQVQLVMAGLIDAMINDLEEGKSVRLGDFGVFRNALRTRAADSEEEATTNCIYRRSIHFTPGKLFKNAVNEMSITRAATPDLDWTKTGKGGTTPGGGEGDDDDYVDPNA